MLLLILRLRASEAAVTERSAYMSMFRKTGRVRHVAKPPSQSQPPRYGQKIIGKAGVAKFCFKQPSVRLSLSRPVSNGALSD
jgi:hypothetical protein